MTLKECDTFDLKTIKGPSDYIALANSTEVVEKMEACMKIWIKQIEQVKGNEDVDMSSVMSDHRCSNSLQCSFSCS